MATVQDPNFKNWLTKPGHHRQIKSLRTTIKSTLGLDFNFYSWPDIYKCFESLTIQSKENAIGFIDIFISEPPTLKKGATSAQIMLYRGALINQVAGLDQELPTLSAEGHTKTMMYRGQKIKANNLESKANFIESNTDISHIQKPKRFYRGAEVKD